MCEADGRMGGFAGGWTVLSSSPPLFRHLPMMQKWVEYVCRAAGGSCIWSTGHQYGDWLALDAGEGNYTGASRKEFIATAFYAHSAQLLAQAMDALDMDGAVYHRLFETIRAAHQNAFPDCRTQTECALALHFGLAAAPDRVAAQLAELVRSNGNRLTTGFVGTPYLCTRSERKRLCTDSLRPSFADGSPIMAVLCQNGRNDRLGALGQPKGRRLVLEHRYELV